MKLTALMIAGLCLSIASPALAKSQHPGSPHHTTGYETPYAGPDFGLGAVSGAVFVAGSYETVQPVPAHQRASYSIPATVIRGGIITVQTAAGIPIKVASSAAGKFQGFIADIVAAGYHPKEIGCYSWGHMRHSLHHVGLACDFDQTARNRTVAFMYHVTAIAHRWGLFDGCEWRDRDCGHIQVDEQINYASIP